MKTILAGCLVVLAMGHRSFSAGERIPAGSRSLAMGGASVALCDIWSLDNNQAGAAWLKGTTAGMGFENHFLLKELMYEQAALAIAMKAGIFGFVVHRFGNSQYSELKAGLSFARKFGKYFSAAVQLDYLRVRIRDQYGNKNLISCEIGLMYQADRHLNFGFQLVNPVPVRITEHPAERLPTYICIGLSYRFSGEFLATGEVEKDLDHPLTYRTGLEYHFAAPAFARIGFSTGPVSFTFGFGLVFGRFQIDMASEYHQALGFSPSGSVTYSFK